MKAKLGYLVIFFVLTGICAGFGVAQGDEEAKGEAENVMIDISELGEKMGVSREEVVMPDGNRFLAQKWSKNDVQKSVAALKGSYNDPDKTYLVTSSPHPAITLAFIHALQPLDAGYLYMEPGGVEVEMCELEKVKELPDFNYGVRFEIIEEEGKLFMNFNSDSPEATARKEHSFDIDNICKLEIPEIPSGKHLFLHARGRYCVMVALAFNYVEDCKSISIAYHEKDYMCAVSFSDKIEVGEVTPRTLPNNL